jgi:hypothetical protein
VKIRKIVKIVPNQNKNNKYNTTVINYLIKYMFTLILDHFGKEIIVCCWFFFYKSYGTFSLGLQPNLISYKSFVVSS